MDWNNIISRVAEATITTVGLQVLGAIVLYIAGRWLISFAVGMLQKALGGQKIEPTLLRFLGNTVSVILNITLVIAILGYFGVQTTSFAALLAGAGLAIGTAWGGLLSNFAAGIFLVVLRPFKVGDFISAGGTTGTVESVGLFVTKIDTPDNVCTYVGNNKLFADNIQNFSTSPYRRVELAAQISGAADPKQVINALKQKIKANPQRRREARTGCGDRILHARRTGARDPPVHQQRFLLAGVFPVHQHGDPRGARRRRLPRSDSSVRDSADEAKPHARSSILTTRIG